MQHNDSSSKLLSVKNLWHKILFEIMEPDQYELKSRINESKNMIPFNF